MSYAIVYSSKTGNTKLLADTLHDCLPQEGCDYFGIPDPAAMEADTLYVGFWTDKGKADESTSDFLKQLHGKNIFLFGTAGFGGSEEYFNKILKKVGEECTEVIIAGEKEDKAETVYEISDLAYHVLVLMVQAGITVEDITRELEKRHVIDHKVKQERMQ